MLRITVLNDPAEMRLKLEGKLAHEWVDEAERAWTALIGMKGDIEIAVVHAGRRRRSSYSERRILLGPNQVVEGPL